MPSLRVVTYRARPHLSFLGSGMNVDHHFVVDPTKFDFYAMDCYRIAGDNKIAETLANEVIQAYSDFDGQERSPMRLAEARITLSVVRAQEGDLDAAIDHGVRALQGKRKSRQRC